MRKLLVILTVSLIAVAPLIITTHLGLIPNVRYYWSNYYGMDYFEVSSSSGYVNIGKEWISIGTIEYEESSSVTLGSGFWSYSEFLRVKEATSSYVSINVERPISKFLHIEEDKVMWRDDNFTSGWTLYAKSQEGSVDHHNDILDVYTNFISGERNYYLLKNNLPHINSTEYPYVFVRWRSTDHVARLDVYDLEGNDYKIIVDSVNGVFHPGTYGGGYGANWTRTGYKLPPNKTITFMDLGVDSGGGGSGPFPVSGIQHAYFDYIVFATSRITMMSYVRIMLNNHIIFNENLTYPVEADMYSFDTSKYNYDYIEIPFDANILQEHNSLSISVGKETNFNVSSPRIYMNTRLEEVKPAWTEIPYHTHLLFIVTFITIAVAFKMINKLRIWIRQQEQGQV